MMKGKKIAIICSFLALCASAAAFAACDKKEETLFGDWITTVEATCEGEGLQTRVSLTDSSVIETRAIPATGHDWNEWEEVTAPTCMTDGVQKRTCNTCENEDFAPIPALGHSWGEWETVAEPTCISEGYKERVCEADGTHTQTEAIEALGHDFGDWVVSLAPTCTQVGSERCVCRNDNHHVQVQALEALGHDWNDPVVTVIATCDKKGETTQFCRNDSSHIKRDYFPALGHDWSEWVLTKAPTETEYGEESRYCANGFHLPELRSVPFLGTKGLRYTLNKDETGYIVSGPNNSSYTEFYIPDTYQGLPVVEIADNAFNSYYRLTKVVFGERTNIQKIGAGAFANCSALEYFGIPYHTKEIGEYAFANSGIKLLHIRTTVQHIGANAFDGWTEEQSVFIAGGVSQTEDWDTDWQSGCAAVIAYETGEEDEYSTDLNFLDNGNGSAAVRVFNKEMSDVTIPATYKGFLVTEIDDSGFIGCTNLTSVVFEGNILEVVGNNAFMRCSALVSVQLPESVITIGHNAFRGCASLSSVRISEGVTSIGRAAFRDCTALMNITLPSTLTSLGKGVFEGWTEEQTIIIKGYASQEEADAAWGEEWREGCNATIIYEG